MRYDPERMTDKQKKIQRLADQHRHRVLEEFKKKQELLAKQTSETKDSVKKESKIKSRQNKLGSRLKKARHHNKQLKAKLQKMQTDRHTQQQKLHQLKKKEADLNDQNTALQEQLKVVKANLNDMKGSKQYIKQLFDARNELERAYQIQRRYNQSLSATNRHLNHQLQNLIHSTENQRLEALKSKNQALSNQINQLKQNQQQLKKSLTETKNQLAGQLVIDRATPRQLIDELFDRLDVQNVKTYLPILGLYHRVEYLLKIATEDKELHRADRLRLHDNQQLYGYLKTIEDQEAFVSLDGSVFPNPQVKDEKFPLVENDVYRGNYIAATDQFIINKRYAALSASQIAAGDLPTYQHHKTRELSKDAFLARFVEEYPDAKRILAGKNVKVVTWFKQISYKRLFQPFDVNLEVLDPSERSGDYIYQKIENLDTDLAFILIEGSHHVNSRIYKDRPAAHPEKIRVLNNASPKELLQMAYDHFKSEATRQRYLDSQSQPE
ncbi:hypothetical protein ACFQ22_11820 [Lentilactobacillus raoultii]|uniref:Uncharacterized protein n=1 Tax=Lentilactobacillus raoultii TaxID=1987503 RepID=A0ABW3PHT1_9LACO|nr:hypothetical protein [Lentilactobacillus raoultii]